MGRSVGAQAATERGSDVEPTASRDTGWAVDSLTETLLPALIGPLLAVQPVFAVAAWTVDGHPRLTAIAVVLHLAAAAECVRILARASSPAGALLMTNVALVVDFVAAVDRNDPLGLATLGIAPLVAMLPILIYSNRASVLASVACASSYAASIRIGHDDWGPSTSIVVTTASLTVSVAALVFIRVLHTIIDRVDQQEQAATHQSRQLVTLQTLHATGAAHIRVLHDTVVNTFGAMGLSEKRWI